MAEKDIVRFSLRLNLKNEQHAKIYRVLSALDKNIHKSENQFIVKAIDFYIQSFEDDAIVDGLRREQKPGYLTSNDLEGMRREIESDLKDELIRLLGSALTGNQAARTQRNMEESIQKIETEESDSVAVEAANLWG